MYDALFVTKNQKTKKMSKFYALIPFVNFTKIQMVLTIWRILDGARCWVFS